MSHRSGSRSGQAMMPMPSSPLSDMTVMLSPALSSGPSGYIASMPHPRKYIWSCGPGTLERIKLKTGLWLIGIRGRIFVTVLNIVGPPNWVQSCSRVGPIAAVCSFGGGISRLRWCGYARRDR